MATLHLFTDDTDTIAAEDAADVWRVMDGIVDPDDGIVWEQIPDDQPISIYTERKGHGSEVAIEIPANATVEVLDEPVGGMPLKVTAPAGDWAALGRRFVCSTEW